MSRIIDIVGVLDNGSTPSADTDPLVPIAYPLTIPQGEDIIIRCAVRNRDGSATNLTGASGALGIGQQPIDASQQGMAPTVLTAGAVQSPASAGNLWFSLLPSQTLPLKPVIKYAWDVWLTLADNTRQRIVLLSELTIEGAVVVPGAPLVAPATVQVQQLQGGLVSFVAESEKTVTLPIAFANTLYKVTLGVNDSVAVYYEKLSASQFKIHSTAPFTGEASWHATP